jgi:hypothetical protein
VLSEVLEGLAQTAMSTVNAQSQQLKNGGGKKRRAVGLWDKLVDEIWVHYTGFHMRVINPNLAHEMSKP